VESGERNKEMNGINERKKGKMNETMKEIIPC
jgi:hypothetical protein